MRCLECRGYDPAGIAVINHDACLDWIRKVGNVENQMESLKTQFLEDMLGIAHPHICDRKVVVVHNGII